MTRLQAGVSVGVACLFSAGLGFMGGLQANPPVVQVPVSGASFVAPEGQTPTALEQKVDKLQQDVTAIKKLLEDLAKEGTDAVVPAEGQREAGVPEALSAGLTTCVGCHNERDAPKKGDRFALFRYEKKDGKDVPVLKDDLRLSEWKNIRRMVKDGEMPKRTSGKRLTPDQSRAIIAEAEAAITELDKK